MPHFDDDAGTAAWRRPAAAWARDATRVSTVVRGVGRDAAQAQVRDVAP